MSINFTENELLCMFIADVMSYLRLYCNHYSTSEIEVLKASESSLEFKVNCEIFGHDPEEEFKKVIQHLLDKDESEFIRFAFHDFVYFAQNLNNPAYPKMIARMFKHNNQKLIDDISKMTTDDFFKGRDLLEKVRQFVNSSLTA